MKNSAWDNKLWQNKMQELPLEGDANAAWQKMQALLDVHLPVANAGIAPKPRGFLGSKLITIIGSIITAAVLFYAAHYVLTHHHKTTQLNDKHPKAATEKVEGKSAPGGKNDAVENAAPAARQNRRHSATNDPAAIKQGGSPNAASGNNNAAANDAKGPLSPKTKGNGVSGQQPTGTDKLIALNNAAPGADTHTSHLKKDAKSKPATKNAGAFSGRHNLLSGNPGTSGRNDHYRPSARHHSAQTNNKGAGGKGSGLSPHQDNQQKQGVDAGDLKQADKGSSKTDSLNAGLVKNNTGITNSPANQLLPGPQTHVDSAALSANNGQPAPKPADIAVNAKNKPGKTNTKAKAKNNKESNSKFELGAGIGLNVHPNSPSAFFNISGAYYIAPKLSVGIGAHITSQRLIEGSYSNSNYKYITHDDTGKKILDTADRLIVKSSGRLYTIGIPIIVSYKLSNIISLKAGPIINIPVRTGTIKNTLNPFKNPVDTLSAYTAITSAANSTTISNQVNFSLSAGVSLYFNRFYIDAAYVQDLRPYTISSSLGSTKVNYHTFQFGIGYLLFKPKK